MKIRTFSLFLIAILSFFLCLGLSFQKSLPTSAQVIPVENSLTETEKTAKIQYQ